MDLMEMNVNWMGFVVGALFGASLILAGLADPDKIVGALRLKDFHAFRVIAVFLLVGMLGVWILDMLDYANYNIKPAALLSNGIGGALLGIGFGMTGYCPGTGLACAAAGRFDALVTVIGMLIGAYFYIVAYPALLYLDSMWNFGNVTIIEYTGWNRAITISAIVLVGAILLLVTAPRRGPDVGEVRPSTNVPHEGESETQPEPEERKQWNTSEPVAKEDQSSHGDQEGNGDDQQPQA